MDLKDVIQKAVEGVDEAQRAYHAGHHEDAESFLEGVNDYMTLYFGEAPPRPKDGTQSTTSEKANETLPETPAEAPGPEVPQVPMDPAAAASEVLPASQFEKPTQ